MRRAATRAIRAILLYTAPAMMSAWRNSRRLHRSQGRRGWGITLRTDATVDCGCAPLAWCLVSAYGAMTRFLDLTSI